jgi:subtilase family serine protease
VCGAVSAGFARCAVRTVTVDGHPAPAAGSPSGLSPANLQSAYKLPSSTAGAGQTVAIVDAYNDPNAEADLGVYRSQFGLPPCTTANGCFRKVNQTGGTS